MSLLKMEVFDRRVVTFDVIISLMITCFPNISEYLPISKFCMRTVKGCYGLYGFIILNFFLKVNFINFNIIMVKLIYRVNLFDIIETTEFIRYILVLACSTEYLI